MRRRRGLLLGALGASLIGLAALAAAGVPSRPIAGPKLELAAGGAVSQSNSLDGRAIVSALDLAPGQGGAGTVRIGNNGSAPGYLGLAATGLSDSAGVGGAVLSRLATLTVTDVTGGSDARIYQGPLDSMPYKDLVTLAPGDERAYRFRMDVPDGGAPSGEWEEITRRSGRLRRSPTSGRWSAARRRRAAATSRAGGGDNTLNGTMGGDRIRGGGGADSISGRAGDDCLRGGPGPDVIRGGPGDDTIRSRGGGRDRVDCGTGRDVAIAGRQDRLRRCETVRIPG